MKTRATISSPGAGRVTAAFTLVEMIGVLAVMAILATVLVPNALKSIERATVRAEGDTLRNLGTQAKLYLRDNAAQPTGTNWNTVLAPYASLAASDVLTNRRQMNRLYVPDPNAPQQRALILSSMRNGVNLPSQAQASAGFATIWNTLDGAVPASGGWGAWHADNIEFLVIERVSFSEIYRTDLRTFTFTVTHTGSSTSAAYQVYRKGTLIQSGTLVPNSSQIIPVSLLPNDDIRLYRTTTTTAANLDFEYIVSVTGKTFVFDGTNWTAP